MGKISRAEHRERVDNVEKMMTLGWRKSEIKRLMKMKYGVSHRSVHRYMACARKRMLEATQKPREEHIADAYAFYQRAKRDEDSTAVSRIKAQERIDKLFGLEAHTRSVTMGVSLTPQEINRMSDEELEQYISKVEEAMTQASQ